MENQRSSVNVLPPRAAVHACPTEVSHARRKLGKELIYSTGISWTSPLVILGVPGLFCRFSFTFDRKSC